MTEHRCHLCKGSGRQEASNHQAIIIAKCACCQGLGYHGGYHGTSTGCLEIVGPVYVYQTVYDESDGTQRRGKDFYTTSEAAAKNSNVMGPPAVPITRHGLLLADGTVWMIEEAAPVRVYLDKDDARRDAALAKLTADERRLLGLAT